mgnify:CR=1 FL=1
MVSNGSRNRRISAQIGKDKQDAAEHYIQSALRNWCKSIKDEKKENVWFAAQDLFGGKNFSWEGTPLEVLYDWHKKNGAKKPFTMAGRDVGHLLSKILKEDKQRYFDTRTGRLRQYLWIK